ncbi:MAG: cellulose synthase operon protein YhjQ/BcsQ [Thermomicrobiales bacterium]
MGLSLQTVLRTMRRWWLLLLLIPIMTGAIAYWVGSSRTPMYASSSTLLISIPSSASLDGYNANLLAQDLTPTYLVLVKTDPVLMAVASTANPPMPVENLRQNTTVSASSGALFTITVVDANPLRAAALVNSLTAAFTKFVDGMLITTDGANAGSVTTIVGGEVPTGPYAPRIPAYVALGIIAGLVLASAAFFLIDSLDTRVRAHTDIAALTGLAPLAALPPLGKDRTGLATIFLDDPQALSANESIRTLRNTIVAAYDPKGTFLVIASPDKADGKTLVAVNLAVAMARAGKFVMLIDGNFREPRLHTIFQLNNAQGLGTLLGESEPSWQTAAFRVSPTLAVMPAGSTGASAAELLAKPAFGGLIDQFLAVADIVILDTPSLNAATSAISAVTCTSHVVLVCRAAKTRIADLHRARVRFDGAGISVLGVVVNQGGGPRSRAVRRKLAFWSHSIDRQQSRRALADV